MGFTVLFVLISSAKFCHSLIKNKGAVSPEKLKSLIKYPVGYQRFKIIFLLSDILSITRSGYRRTGGRFDPGKNDCLFLAFAW